MHSLDNAIWTALTTKQAHFAQSCDSARKFPKEVSILGAFPEPTMEAYQSLARLLEPEESVGLFLDGPPEPAAGFEVVRSVPLLQMVCENGSTPAAEIRAAVPVFVRLGDANVAEMLALTELTVPGPFGRRTHEMGDYFGIQQAGNLVAMAGERLRLPGYTEISAVCTHPDHLGHGYATALMTMLVERIRRRGEQPFLHVRPENTRAVALYERLGFRKRALLQYAILRRCAT